VDPASITLTFRRVLLSGILGLALLVPASVIPWPGSAATCAAASTHRVAVVVQHGGGATLSRCVSFTTDSISGEQALAGSHIEAGLLPSGGFGKAVCQLDNEPATYPPTCWTGTSPFWALFVAHGGGWAYSTVGVSSIVLHDGDWLGFRYQSQSKHDPPSSGGDCPDPTPPPATPKPTPKPTAPPTLPPKPTPARTAAPPTVSPGATVAVASPPVTPSASASGGGIAAASEPPEPSSTPAPSVPSAGASGGTPPTAAAPETTPTSGGDAPIGLILVAVAGLAFAALGVFQLRRAP
jgi:hypothetical protein